jgi:UDP-GlcNAc3NAcA epimerase
VQESCVKIATVVGARPQFIKAAAMSRVLRETAGLHEVIIHTGQHYDPALSSMLVQELDLPEPDHHLGIGSAPHGAQTGRMLEALERVLANEQPRGVIVFGDTNSTLAGALAAAKLHIPVAHVEAGLRSWDRRMPEELNRVVTDQLSDLLFAPTESAKANLSAEGIPSERVHVVGDVMYDAALRYGGKRVTGQSDSLELQDRNYILATIHRAENTDDPPRLRRIIEALAEIGREIAVVLPMHPRTRSALRAIGLEAEGLGFSAIEPVGYLEMLALEKSARLIVTDSGGVQKEAFFCRVPCVTLRENTEWVELVESGWNRLVPPIPGSDIAGQIRLALDSTPPSEAASLYGGGQASKRIRDILVEIWG